ncbi:MAG: ABC transporter permease [Bryobacterales bacterium]|nr:ABC transporter permease [Bryobacterales bacterium]
MGWIRALLRRRKMEDALDQETHLHIDLQTEEYIRSGMSPAEARAAAQRRFGNLASVHERCREENGITRLETMWQDIRFAARTLTHQPGFTATVLLTLALGIGANTALFSVLQGILFKPLPLPDPDRVVIVWETDRVNGTTRENASYPDFLDMKQQTKHFEHLAAIQRMDVTLSGTGEPERVSAARVTASYFAVLGLQPLLGRPFSAGEDGVVLSHKLWHRNFGGHNGVIGRNVLLDGVHCVIVAVMPPAATLHENDPELWSSMENLRASQHRGQHNTRVVGRLHRGVSIAQAQTEMTAIMARLEQHYPQDNKDRGASVVSLHEDLAGNMRPALKILTAAVVGVLLIACVNIANLLLARATSRTREMAVRGSLGASRPRLARQLLTESLVLSLLGGLLAIAVAYAGLQALVALAPPGTPLVDRIQLDAGALAATLGLSLLAWVIFGALPAIETSAIAPGAAIQTRSAAGTRHRALLHSLIVVEVALSAVLVIAAGLLIKSFWRLHQVDIGFHPSHVISLRMKLPETDYPWPKWPFREWPKVTAFHERLKAAAQSVPGVDVASVALADPMRELWTTRVAIEGRPMPKDGSQKEAQYRAADEDYLRVTGAVLKQGRFFRTTDDSRHPMVAVVNESFAREYFAGQSAIGSRIVVFETPREIVGIMGDIRYSGPGSPSPSTMYFPMRQQPWPDCTLIARATGDAALLSRSLQQAVRSADASVAPFDVTTLDSAFRQSTARERFVLSLLTVFGTLALLLAIIGVYGVAAYAVQARRAEIAVRIALGARRIEVYREVTSRILAHAALGVGAGLVCAALCAPLLQPLVFQTSPRDLLTYAAVTLTLLLAALLGAARPARQAAAIDPAIVLREQ